MSQKSDTSKTPRIVALGVFLGLLGDRITQLLQHLLEGVLSCATELDGSAVRENTLHPSQRDSEA